MSITIRNLKRRPGGGESIRERIFDQESLTIGRDASNDLAITDLALALKHAKIKRGQDGLAVLELISGNTALVNNRLVTGRVASLKPGTSIRLGRFELRLEQPTSENNITLTLEQIEVVETNIGAEDEQSVFALSRALPSKRITAWVLSLAVLGFFLALPIWAANNKTSEYVKTLPVQADLSWNTGEISLMHANLKNDCTACHAKPFVAVKDETCAECHDNLRDHAKPSDLKTSRPEAIGFNAKLNKVSEAFGRPVDRCASCHAEHNTRAKMIPKNQDLCTDCHRDLDKKLPKTALKNVSDFGFDHPQFSPSIITKPDFKNPEISRISLDANPKGFSGLKFPHDIHMNTKSAVAKMAQKLNGKYGEQYPFNDGVDCADCHRPEAGGALFEPVSMVQDCAMCHDLGFEKEGTFIRTLRHGEPKEVIATMRDYYLAAALANIRDVEKNSRTRRRPGRAAKLRDLNRRELAFKQADIRTAAKVKTIFSKGGACFDCHIIDSPTDPKSLDYRVQPISVDTRFYPKSLFDHSSHDIGNLECKDCHNAAQSKLSSDVLLPKIDVCRDCHVGEDTFRSGEKTKEGTLPTTCLTCHAYHNGPHGEIMATAPKQTKRGAP